MEISISEKKTVSDVPFGDLFVQYPSGELYLKSSSESKVGKIMCVSVRSGLVEYFEKNTSVRLVKKITVELV